MRLLTAMWGPTEMEARLCDLAADERSLPPAGESDGIRFVTALPPGAVGPGQSHNGIIGLSTSPDMEVLGKVVWPGIGGVKAKCYQVWPGLGVKTMQAVAGPGGEPVYREQYLVFEALGAGSNQLRVATPEEEAKIKKQGEADNERARQTVLRNTAVGVTVDALEAETSGVANELLQTVRVVRELLESEPLAGGADRFTGAPGTWRPHSLRITSYLLRNWRTIDYFITEKTNGNEVVEKVYFGRRGDFRIPPNEKVVSVHEKKR
jgi:hypothetical protein